jgi:RNA polymerase sigma-70 factor (family 1)
MPSPNVYNEKDIITHLALGDVNAFRLVFNRYRNEIFTYCYKVTKSKEPAEEIVHDVFLIMWQKREQLDISLPVKPYLYKITQNLAFNFLKKAANEQKLKQAVFYFQDLHDNQPERDINYKDTKNLLAEAISQLPAERKRIFKMSRYQGLNHDEIATQLDISKNTVKDQMFKALRSIKQYLELHNTFFTLFIFFLVLFL